MKTEKNHRHGHAFQRAVLAERCFAAERIQRKAAGHHYIFNGAQHARHILVRSNGRYDIPQLPSQPLHRTLCVTGHVPQLTPVAPFHIYPARSLADRIAHDHGRAGRSDALRYGRINEQRHHADAHDLLEDLRAGIRPHLAPRHEKTPQTCRNRHKRQTGRQNAQRERGPRILQPPVRCKPRSSEQQRGRSRAKPKPQRQCAAHGCAHIGGVVGGQQFRRKTRGCHRKPRRSRVTAIV